jgi:hypothetical protein
MNNALFFGNPVTFEDREIILETLPPNPTLEEALSWKGIKAGIKNAYSSIKAKYKKWNEGGDKKKKKQAQQGLRKIDQVEQEYQRRVDRARQHADEDEDYDHWMAPVINWLERKIDALTSSEEERESGLLPGDYRAARKRARGVGAAGGVAYGRYGKAYGSKAAQGRWYITSSEEKEGGVLDESAIADIATIISRRLEHPPKYAGEKIPLDYTMVYRDVPCTFDKYRAKLGSFKSKVKSGTNAAVVDIYDGSMNSLAGKRSYGYSFVELYVPVAGLVVHPAEEEEYINSETSWTFENMPLSSVICRIRDLMIGSRLTEGELECDTLAVLAEGIAIAEDLNRDHAMMMLWFSNAKEHMPTYISLEIQNELSKLKNLRDAEMKAEIGDEIADLQYREPDPAMRQKIVNQLARSTKADKRYREAVIRLLQRKSEEWELMTLAVMKKTASEKRRHTLLINDQAALKALGKNYSIYQLEGMWTQALENTARKMGLEDVPLKDRPSRYFAISRNHYKKLVGLPGKIREDVSLLESMNKELQALHSKINRRIERLDKLGGSKTEMLTRGEWLWKALIDLEGAYKRRYGDQAWKDKWEEQWNQVAIKKSKRYLDYIEDRIEMTLERKGGKKKKNESVGFGMEEGASLWRSFLLGSLFEGASSVELKKVEDEGRVDARWVQRNVKSGAISKSAFLQMKDKLSSIWRARGVEKEERKKVELTRKARRILGEFRKRWEGRIKSGKKNESVGLTETAAQVASFAKKTGKSITEVERLWQKAKAQAAKQGRAGNYAYIVGILKRMLGIRESVIDESHLNEIFGWSSTEKREKEAARKKYEDKVGAVDSWAEKEIPRVSDIASKRGNAEKVIYAKYRKAYQDKEDRGEVKDAFDAFLKDHANEYHGAADKVSHEAARKALSIASQANKKYDAIADKYKKYGWHPRKYKWTTLNDWEQAYEQD